MVMRHMLAGIVALAGIGGVASVYTAKSVLSQAETSERFVQLVKSDFSTFSDEVENAVGECVQLQSLPDDMSRRVRTISSKVVAKIMHLRATRDPTVDLRPQIMLWLKDQLEQDFDSLSDENFDLLIKEIGSVIGSTDTIQCIVSAAVSRHE